MKSVMLMMVVSLLGCTKLGPLFPLPGCTTIVSVDKELEERAQSFANWQWGGFAKLKSDAFYFSIFEYEYKSDTSNYKSDVLDKKTVSCFRYIFGPFKNNPEYWKSRVFLFEVTLENGKQVITQTYSYSLNQPMFYFLKK